MGEFKKINKFIKYNCYIIGVMVLLVLVKKRVVYISVFWGCVGYLNKFNGYLN